MEKPIEDHSHLPYALLAGAQAFRQPELAMFVGETFLCLFVMICG